MTHRTPLLLSLLLLLGLGLPVQAQHQLINGDRTIAGWLNAVTTTGTPNTYSATLAKLGAYLPKLRVTVTIHAPNTGAVTLNINSLGALPVQKWAGGTLVALTSGDLVAGQVIEVIYDTSRWQVLTLASAGTLGGLGVNIVPTVCTSDPNGGKLTVIAGTIQCSADIGGGAGSTAFGTLATGTNTTATMAVGTGASLAPTGTGTITANRLTSTAPGLVEVDAVGLPTLAEAADVVTLFGGGACTGYLKSDGTCDASAGGTGANPTATIGLSVVNGVAATFLRSDAAPPLNQGIAPTWTGTHTFSAAGVLNASGASATRPVKAGTAKPGTCTANLDLFIDTDDPAGQQLYLCNGAGTGWTLLGDGGGAGSTGANPTATLGLAAINGIATTFMRSDAAPALSQAIAPTWTGTHTFGAAGVLNASGASATRPVKAGTTKPVTCAANLDLFIDTDDTVGQQFYLCNAAGTGWTLLGDGTGAAGTVTIFGSPTAGQAAQWQTGTSITGVAVTGTGSYVKGISPILQTPDLGTPTALVLTSATGLPTTGILNDAVTYAKIQNVSVTDRLLGRDTAGAGDIEELTPAAVKTMLAIVSTDLTDSTALARLTVSNTWTDGAKQIFNPSATVAGLNVGGQAGDPSTLVNGDLWYDSTANTFDVRINGVTTSLVPASTTINAHPLTGNIILDADDFGLGNVQNTTDATKNVATAVALALDPAACGAGLFVMDIAANGTLSCLAPTGTRHIIHAGTTPLSDDPILRFTGAGVTCTNGAGADADKIICDIPADATPNSVTATNPFAASGRVLTAGGADRTVLDGGILLSALALKAGGGAQQMSGTAFLPRRTAITLNQSPTASVVAGPATADVAYHYALTGNILFGIPTGTVSAGQTLDFILKSATPVPIAWTQTTGGYCSNANIPLPTITSGAPHYNRYRFEYNDDAGCYLFVGQSAAIEGEAGNSVSVAELDGSPSGLFTTIQVPNGSLSTPGGNIAVLTYLQPNPVAGTQTITNTRIQSRVQSLTTVAGTPGQLQIDCALYDQVTITAQANDLQFLTPVCTPTNGQWLTIVVTDNGTQRALTWVSGANAFSAPFGLSLPTITTLGGSLAVQVRWNSTTSRWEMPSATVTAQTVASPLTLKALTDGTGVNILQLAVASNTGSSVRLDYQVEVLTGTNQVQVEDGFVLCRVVNQNGVLSLNTCSKTVNQALGTGTLTTTWAVSAANPAQITLNADTSLTASAGYPRLRYSALSLGGQALTVQ